MTKTIEKEAFTKTIFKGGNPNNSTTLSELILTIDSGNNIGADATAFQTNVTGANNIAIGDTAGLSVITNNNSSFFGKGADANDGLDNVTVIGANAKVATPNTVMLGNASSVVIGTDTAQTGLTLGSEVVPAIYLANNTSITPPTVAIDDGAFYVKNGTPTFANSTGEKTLFSLGSVAAGSPSTTAGQTLNGTMGVVVNSAAIKTTSVVIVTRNNITGVAPDITTVGNLTVGGIVAGTSFTVYSSVATDNAPFNWIVINA